MGAYNRLEIWTKCTNISSDNLNGRDDTCVDERMIMMMIMIIKII
jgi:hypothetical protein